MNAIDQPQLLKDFGYVKHQNISNNGNIFLAYNQNKNNEPVVIKKVSKTSSQEYSAVSHLPADQHNFARFIDSFESEKHFYVVLEHNFNVNLSEFVLECHKYIKYGKLKAKHYCKKMRYLLFQLIQILHSGEISCKLSTVHLDNIMVRNAEFIHNADGSIAINPEIDIVYINMMDTQDDVNAVYGLGLIMYFVFVGQHLYSDNDGQEFSALWAVRNNKLKSYLLMNQLSKCVNKKVLKLLNSLLNIEVSQRPDSHSILMHPFFNKKK
eukprot:424607_1